MPRLNNDWIDTFVTWLTPQIEAPALYVEWTAIAALSAALRRNVCIPRRILRNWEVTPALYIIFVAPPGIVKKSSTLSHAKNFLDSLTNVTRVPDALTKEALIDFMQQDNCVTILSSEFSTLLHKSKNEMYEMLTELFDGKDEFKEKTLMRGEIVIFKPAISIIAATTPEWLGGQISTSTVGSGFISRVIIVYEDTIDPDKVEIFYDHLDIPKLDKLEEGLKEDLRHINDNLTGEYDFDTDAKEFVRKWYKDLMKKIQSGSGNTDTRIRDFIIRKHTHLLRVSMLYAASRSDELIIKQCDVNRALTILEATERRLPAVFDLLSVNKGLNDLKDVVSYVKSRGKVTRAELLRTFLHRLSQTMFDDIIATAIQVGQLESYEEKNERFYRAI